MIMSSKQYARDLIDAHEALDVYLDTLLHQAPDSDTETEIQDDEEVMATGIAESTETHQSHTEIPMEPLSEASAEVTASVEHTVPGAQNEQVITPVNESVLSASQSMLRRDTLEYDAKATKIPTTPFQSLIFTVGKLNIAVPINDVACIMKWPAKITSTPGQPLWNIGVYSERHERFCIVDTARFVIPENRSDLMPEQNSYQHIIVIGDKRWGLACNHVSKVISLDPEQVKWSGKRNFRPWLAGTVIEQMCALLNIDHFINMLEESDVNVN